MPPRRCAGRSPVAHGFRGPSCAGGQQLVSVWPRVLFHVWVPWVVFSLIRNTSQVPCYFLSPECQVGDTRKCGKGFEKARGSCPPSLPTGSVGAARSS